ncbi:TetR family transcriptional regulator [Nocardia puris]|uniref:TetR family transcriptional regulator n=1 Tax=Nocardia puris TaxID=208602 RepID=A0A366D644_9NOCA|nr:TetR family transcriptional regulator [Nocardia puris]MBF6212273.1 TetR family transcriptional regulator [Nocardia puris]MBF6366520.1 TetR family transcriptional regulator [Nocardia puris]MBF6460862.1 TetR family transcriptional regulator [Nocardia puris]RBO85507.1 TetR family transcriptional regulator [Nocardia puris]
MARPRVPLLSRDRIRAAALALIDRDGLTELSMRKLAAELGVRAASLYGHYPTKDDLLDDIAREIMSHVDASAFEGGAWRAALASWARSFRAALAAHPNFVPYLATSGPGHRDGALRAANAVHGGLVRAGWPPRRATMIGAATRYLVLGSTVGSFSRGFADDADLYRDRYPHLDRAHLLREKADEIDAESFELGLTAFLDGLETQFAALGKRRARRRATPDAAR